jgi:hypothetical protein
MKLPMTDLAHRDGVVYCIGPAISKRKNVVYFKIQDPIISFITLLTACLAEATGLVSYPRNDGRIAHER